MLANLFGMGFVDGAGVGLFLGNADVGEEVDNGLGLDLEFAGQIVDADLIGVLRHTQWI
jgi:hypothetical protein